MNEVDLSFVPSDSRISKQGIETLTALEMEWCNDE